MTRNRRDSTSVTFAIGRGCFLLLIGAVCVGFSVTKIVVGSEYVNNCPSREMIPVYVLVSGCLPVLLSALRQPYNAGHAMDKERCSMKISLVTAVVGVMVNLAWLVAGTYLVVTTWNGNICQIPTPNRVTTTAIPENTSTSGTNEKFGSELVNNQKNTLQGSTQFPIRTVIPKHDLESYKDSQGKYTSGVTSTRKIDMADEVILGKGNKTSQNDPSTTMISETYTKVNSEVTTSAMTIADDIEKGVVTNNKDSESNRLYKKEETIDNSSTEVNESDTDVAVEGADTRTVTTKSTTPQSGYRSTKDARLSDNKSINSKPRVQKLKSEEQNMFTKKTSQERLCITCDIHILRFSLAVVIIDWLFVMIGVVYFCHFVYHRFASLKDQLLLINA